MKNFVSFQTVDRIPYSTIPSIFGNMGMLLAFTFIGPLPFIPTNSSLSLSTGCTALFGFSRPWVIISTLIRAQRAAVERGYTKDDKTYGLISGMKQMFE